MTKNITATATSTATATFTKLRSGAWGIRATTKVAEGDRVEISKKDGTTKMETVAKIVWTDGSSVWLCAIGAPATTAAKSRRTFVPCGYPGCNEAYCDDCDGAGGYASGW